MDYKILITPIAGQDLADHMNLISIESREHANKWLEEAWSKIFSLQNLPYRNALSEEGKLIGIRLADLFKILI